LWFTCLLSVSLPFYGASVINTAMSRDLQFDKTTIGLGFSMVSLIWGFSGPLAALMLNRIGIRYTVTIGALIITAGTLSMALFVNNAWAFVAVFGVVVGVGLGLGTNLPTQTGITLWFSKKRALVLSLVMTASGVGGFFAPPLLNRIIAASDWRTAWLIVAATSLLCAAIAAIFLRNKPADLGQHPDGIAPDANRPVTHIDTPWAPRDVIRSPGFWQILLGGILFAAPTPLLIAHGVAHLEGLGHTQAVAAWALGLMLLFSVAGRVIAGFLCDRFPPRLVWAGMMLLISAGVGFVSVATSSTQIAAFAVLMGIGFGGSFICWVATTAQYFGPASFATVMGMQTPISTLAVSAVPTLAGMLYDSAGNFSLALWSVTAGALLGAVAITTARAPVRPVAVAV
jgi:MFS family permease